MYLVLLAAVLGLAFWGVQRLFEYLIGRNQRHHKAIAQLEYILGRRFNRLANNVKTVAFLQETIRRGDLGAMFPTPLHPDDSGRREV